MNPNNLKEIHVSGVKSIQEIIVSHLHLVSILINAGWFPKEPDLVIEVSHSIEIDRYCHVVQFTGREKDKQNIVPCLATVMINVNPGLGLIVFRPVQIVGCQKAAYIEEQCHKNEEIFSGQMKTIFPAFDCSINQPQNPTRGLVIIKLLVSYFDFDNTDKFVAQTDIIIYSAVLQKIDDFNWKSSFYQIPDFE